MYSGCYIPTILALLFPLHPSILFNCSYICTKWHIQAIPTYMHHKFWHLPYSLDQTPLSNSRRTSGSAEQNSRHSRIVAAPRLLFEKHVST